MTICYYVDIVMVMFTPFFMTFIPRFDVVIGMGVVVMGHASMLLWKKQLHKQSMLLLSCC